MKRLKAIVEVVAVQIIADAVIYLLYLLIQQL